MLLSAVREGDCEPIKVQWIRVLSRFRSRPSGSVSVPLIPVLSCICSRRAVLYGYRTVPPPPDCVNGRVARIGQAGHAAEVASLWCCAPPVVCIRPAAAAPPPALARPISAAWWSDPRASRHTAKQALPISISLANNDRTARASTRRRQSPPPTVVWRRGRGCSGTALVRRQRRWRRGDRGVVGTR